MDIGVRLWIYNVTRWPNLAISLETIKLFPMIGGLLRTVPGSVNISSGSADPQIWIKNMGPVGQSKTDQAESGSFLDVFVATGKNK